MYSLQPFDAPQSLISIKGPSFSIGRADSNAMVIDDLSISPLHANLLVEDADLLLKDNNSESGTFVNGQRVTSKKLEAGDELRFGNSRYFLMSLAQTSDAWTLKSLGNWLPESHFRLSDNKTTLLGRGRDCHISLPRTHLAREHAKLTPIEAGVLVKDLGSTSGTYINNQRIQEGIAVNGDRLRFDVYRFQLTAPTPTIDLPKPKESLAKILQPVERKTVSNTPKQWKTAPTSPGNRIEPKPARQHQWMLTLSALLLFVGLGLLIYLFS